MNKYDRRTFFKTLLSVPASLLFNEICAGESESNMDYRKIRIPKSCCDREWRNFIVCISEDPWIKSEIEKCAQNMNCRVFHGELVDLYAMRGFVDILDRSTFDIKEWNDYVAFCDQFYEDVPCIVIDDIQDLVLPRTKTILRFDLHKPDSIAGIISSIKYIKKQVDKNWRCPKQLDL